MFLRRFDRLSPPITLYFRGQKKHYSLFSGILTIIAYILIIISGIYYILEFINKENPIVYFFNKYIEDAGEFPLNASSIFSFIQLIDTVSNEPIPMDFQAFRILGFDEVYSTTYITDDDGSTPKKRNPTEFNHWLYGPCNNDSDLVNISHLINFQYFEESACIRKYYDKNNRKYYDVSDPNFKWPIIIKGCSNPNRTFYGIIMEKCRNDKAHELSGYPECKNETEINNAINKNSMIMQIIDQYADTLNYEDPFKKYFYAITTALTPDNYIINHLNFNPAVMITHDGLLLDKISKIDSYFFTQNEKQILKTDTSTNVNIYDCLLGFYFWMQNSLQYYERTYKRLQDVLSEIGGINSIVIVGAEIANYLVKGYIILLDTEDLILTVDKNNFEQREIGKKPTLLKKAYEIFSPPKRVYRPRNLDIKDQLPSSNYQRLMKEGINIYPNISPRDDIKDENSEKNENISMKRRSSLFDNSKNNLNYNRKMKNDQQIIQEDYKSRIYNKKKKYNNKAINKIGNDIKKNYSNSFNNNNLIDGNAKDIKDEKFKPIEKQNFSFYSYIKYIICCKKNNRKISYYEYFRNIIISEENLLQNHLDIYQLLKICNINKKSCFISKE